MKVENLFGKSKVVVLKVGQEDIDGLLINWDLTDNGKFAYMEKEFISMVMNYLPEYAMGYDSKLISQLDIVPLLREAANSVIKIKKIDEIKKYLDSQTPYDQWEKEILKTYNSKGIFSELILHFLLRDMIYIPLLCIYEDNVATSIIDALNQEGDYDRIYFEHVISMKKYFDTNNNFPNNDKVQPLLILLPVESKDRIITAMLS